MNNDGALQVIDLAEVLCFKCAEPIDKCECPDGFWLGDPQNDCNTAKFYFVCACVAIVIIYFVVFLGLFIKMFGGG